MPTYTYKKSETFKISGSGARLAPRRCGPSALERLGKYVLALLLGGALIFGRLNISCEGGGKLIGKSAQASAAP